MVLRCVHGETSGPQTHFAGSSEAPACCPAGTGLVTAQGACPQRDQTDGSRPTALDPSARTAWLPQPQISSAHWAALGSLFSKPQVSCRLFLQLLDEPELAPVPKPAVTLGCPRAQQLPLVTAHGASERGGTDPCPARGHRAPAAPLEQGGQTQGPGGTRVAWGRDGAPGTGRRAQAAQTCNPGLRTNSWRLNSRWDGGKRGQILIYSLFRDGPQKRWETPQTHT